MESGPGRVPDYVERREARGCCSLSHGGLGMAVTLSDAATWICKGDGVCTFLSHHWLSWVGDSLENSVGDGWLGHLHPEDRNRAFDTLMAGIEFRQPFEVHYRLRSGGEWKWHRGSGLPITESGVVLAVHGFTVPVPEYLPLTVYRGNVPHKTRLFRDPRHLHMEAAANIYRGTDRQVFYGS